MKKTLQYLVIIYLVSFFNASAQTASLDATLSLKDFNGAYIPYQNGMPVPSFEKQDRQMINLKGEWKKQRFLADDNISLSKRDASGYSAILTEALDRYKSDYDDSGWETKNIPSVENTMYPYPKVPEYYEDGIWYRYKFNVSDSLNGKFIKLMFYSVNYVCDVWLNDNYLGYHEGGFTPFAFDVSTKINYGSDNVVAVRVDNPEWGTRNDIVPYYEVDWFNYAGIIHDVYLEITNPVNVVRANIVTQDLEGNIQASVLLKNKNTTSKDITAEIKIYNTIIDSINIHTEKASEITGSLASYSGTSQSVISVPADSVALWNTNIKINNPEFWFTNDPNLYVLKVTLKEGNNILDEFYTQFGIRLLTREGDKILLNNKVVFLTGVARHEDHPLYGRSMPLDTIFSDLQKVRGLNANYLRTAHYPNHLYTYLIADRLGIAIVEEIPVWWFDEAEPWQIQNNSRHIHEQMFKEMVYKDFNRPSVFMWSLCNECRDVENRKIFIENMFTELNDKIKDGRLITQSAAANRPGPDDDSQKACDVAGWTMYFGIFHGSTYEGGTNNFLIRAKLANPGKPVLDTEFGYWSGEDFSQFDRQEKAFTETFNAFKNFAPITASKTFNKDGFLAGITWWCIFDWYTHSLSGGFQSMGLYSMDRSFMKPVGQLLKESYAPYFSLGNIITDVDDEKKSDALPGEFKLEQNYPNPFNPITNFRFRIPDFGLVTLKVYDIIGNEVAVLINKEMAAGDYNIEFDGGKLASGVYIYELRAGEFNSSKKLILLK